MLLLVISFFCFATRLDVHASISLSTVSPSSCTLCYGGSSSSSSSFNANATFGGSPATSSLTCGDVNTVIHDTSANDPTCLQLQLQAYQYCNCSTFPPSYCAMCQPSSPGGRFVPISQPNQVIFNPQWNLTCQDALFASNDSIPLVPSSSSSSSSSSLDSPLYGPGACQRIAAWAYACGCPGSIPPPCSTCLDRQLVDATKLMPPFFETTCQQFANVASYAGSETVCQAQYAAAPVDVVAYCGGCVVVRDNVVVVNNETSPLNGSAQTTTSTTTAISTVANTGTCSLCQASLQQFVPPPSSASFAKLNDTIITLTNLRRNRTAVSTNQTCFELFQWVHFVTSPSYCHHLQSVAAAPCCEVVTTAAPTPIVTARPTSIPVSVLAQRFTISPAPTMTPTNNHQHSPSSSSSSSSSSAQQSTSSAATTMTSRIIAILATLATTLVASTTTTNP